MRNHCLIATLLLSTLGALSVASTPCYAANYKGEGGFKPAAVTKSTTVTKVAPKPSSFDTPIVLKGGAYFGIAGGYDSYKVHENIQIASPGLSASLDQSINGTGIVGEILAGYGQYFNRILYLGGEVFLNVSSVYQNGNATFSSGTDTISYNSKFIVTSGYGVGMLPGVKLSDSSLFYARLGYQVARLRGQENASLNNGTPFISNTSSWSGGVAYGLGFEEAMGENLSLRGDYIHTDYRSFSATSGTEYSASDNQFMLGLIYHINL